MCFIRVQILHSFNIPVRHSKMIEIPLKFKIKVKLQRVIVFEVPRIFIQLRFTVTLKCIRLGLFGEPAE